MNKIINQIKITLNKNHLNLNTKLTESVVLAFETTHKISLPNDYKIFLMRIGNGGDGPPEYGLLKLGEIKVNDIPDYLLNGYEDRLKQLFPFKKQIIWDEDSADFEEKIASAERGCLVLGHDGCGIFWLLIINGDNKGEIWQTSEMGIQPCLPKLTFTQWYLNWLEGKINCWDGYQ